MSAEHHLETYSRVSRRIKEIEKCLEYIEKCEDLIMYDNYEVKITANVSSVRQLVHYKRSIDTYLQYKSKLNPVLTELPTVSLTLMARNFDMEIIDLCNELNIALWKVNVLSKEKIDIEHFDTEFLKPVHDSPSFVKDLRSFFGGTNG